MATQKQIDAVVKFVETYLERDEAYDKMNSLIHSTVGDFAPHQALCDSSMFTGFLKVMDALFGGDDIIDYFLFEVPTMRGGGLYNVNGTEYVLKTPADLRRYLECEHLTKTGKSV